MNAAKSCLNFLPLLSACLLSCGATFAHGSDCGSGGGVSCIAGENWTTQSVKSFGKFSGWGYEASSCESGPKVDLDFSFFRVWKTDFDSAGKDKMPNDVSNKVPFVRGPNSSTSESGTLTGVVSVYFTADYSYFNNFAKDTAFLKVQLVAERGKSILDEEIIRLADFGLANIMAGESGIAVGKEYVFNKDVTLSAHASTALTGIELIVTPMQRQNGSLCIKSLSVTHQY